MARVLLSCLAALTLLAAGPACAQNGLAAALERAGARDWAGAARAVASAPAEVRAVIEWQRLRRGEGSFDDYRTFLAAYPDWPGMALLSRQGEAAIPASADPGRIRAYFSTHPPQTGEGALRLAEALIHQGDRAGAAAEAVRAWRDLPIDPVTESVMLAEFGQALAPHHIARMDRLLWDHRFAEAARMRPRVPEGWRLLHDARVSLARDEAGVDTRIAAVPADLADDPGLARERAAWRARRGRVDDAATLMLARSASPALLGRPEAWASRRAALVRQMMREGKDRRAYLLAAQHHLTRGSAYADLEWLAGYIALRRLDAPGAALDHFRRFRLAVTSPISLGRAGYWEGRAHEAMDQVAAARAAYAFGAEFQTSFYGQLAAERAGLGMDPRLVGAEVFPDAHTAPFTGSSVYKAGQALAAAGDAVLAARFFAHLAEGLSRTEIGQLTTLLAPLDAPYIELQVAKRAASAGHMLHRAYFPLMPIATDTRPDVSPELALAIARRESEFNTRVISPAGARGLMQVMPGTARDTAAELGMGYALTRLTGDPAYNAALGTAYLQKLRNEFGVSVALVAVGYNAGPARARQWLAAYGDPRDPGIDVIDWIEGLPFTETRNYVMRVSESLGPYRARLGGRPVALALTRDLTGRAPVPVPALLAVPRATPATDPMAVPVSARPRPRQSGR